MKKVVKLALVFFAIFGSMFLFHYHVWEYNEEQYHLESNLIRLLILSGVLTALVFRYVDIEVKKK